MDIGIRQMTILTLIFAMFLSPPTLCNGAHTRTHTYTQNQRRGDLLERISCRRENQELWVVMYLTTPYLHDQHHFPFMLLFLTSQSW